MTRVDRQRPRPCRSLAAIGRAPELAAYQDEPRQMRSAVVGKSGALRLGFERRGARTALVTMERQVPLLVQRPLYWDRSLPGMACVTIIHTSGSVLQGDRFQVRIDVGPGAQAYVTTQAATKIHEMDANYAAQRPGHQPGPRRVPGVPARGDHPASSLALRRGYPGHLAR